MSKADDISTIEKILQNESRKEEILTSLAGIEKESFRAAPQPPQRRFAKKKPYPPVVLTTGMKLSEKILPVLISISFGVFVIFVASHIMVFVSGYRSIGQFVYFNSLAITILIMLFIHATAIGLSIPARYISRFILRKKHQRAVRNTDYYKQQHFAIDEEFKTAQKWLDDQYLQEMSYFQQTILPRYENEKAEWTRNRKNRISSLNEELQSIKTETSRLYSKVSVIPPVLRNPDVLSHIILVLKNTDFTLEQLIEYAKDQAKNGHKDQSYDKSSGYQTTKREHDYFAGCNTWKEVKIRWKELAKKHHSDVGGNEEVMKAINQQYNELKAKFGKRG